MNRLTIRTSGLLVVLLCCFANASDDAHKDSIQPVKLTLSPAAQPTPALKYTLLPVHLERRAGNAAPMYLKAFLLLTNADIDDKTWEQVAQWVNAPPEELPQDDAREVLKRFGLAYGELQRAAHRDRCEWEMAERERGQDIFATLLPEVQQFRSAARLIALKARLEIAGGHYEQAIQTLQVGYALARHVAQQPFLVSGLVGAAIAGQMTDQLERLIDSPDSPNMYWAIASLPTPLIDPHPALELEGSALFLMFPELRDLETQDRTAGQWRQLWRSFFVKTGGLVGGSDADEKQGEAGRLARIAMADAIVEVRFPTAKKDLLGRGYEEASVEKMGRAQVVLLSEVLTFKELRDEFFKWSHVPYWQARDGLEKAKRRMEERMKVGLDEKLKTGSIADLLLPAVGAAVEGFYVADQRLAALQTVEALRMYAAVHDGQLPKTLADVTEAPLPINPYTGEPADYHLHEDNGRARLTMTAPRKDRVRVYELAIAK